MNRPDVTRACYCGDRDAHTWNSGDGCPSEPKGITPERMAEGSAPDRPVAAYDDLVVGECRNCIVACGSCPDVLRSALRARDASSEHLASEWATAMRALVACASHLTALGRPDLSPLGDCGDLIPCPRCEGQEYDRGSCGLCRNVGMLDANGEALRVDA